MQRYFYKQPLATGMTVELDAAVQKHAVQVLRMQAGGQFELADSEAHAYVVSITNVKPLTVTVGADITKPVELPLAVTIVCGIAKAQKAELVTQKATELGVSRIIFANSQWGTARWQPSKADRKLERLQLIARGAAEQSHRNVVPTVEFMANLTDAAQLQADQLLVAYEESAKEGEAAQLLQSVRAARHDLVVVFGPEGGIAPEELAQLTAAGYKAAGLGPRILRTETAPLYLLSAVSALTELGKDE